MSFEAPPHHEPFSTLWDTERTVRHDCFAPKWNSKRKLMTTNIPWETVFQSWNRIDSSLHLSNKKHVQKLQRLRMSASWVSKSGT